MRSIHHRHQLTAPRLHQTRHQRDVGVIGSCAPSSRADKTNKGSQFMLPSIRFSPPRSFRRAVIVYVDIHLSLWHGLNCWQAVHHSAQPGWDTAAFCVLYSSTGTVTPVDFKNWGGEVMINTVWSLHEKRSKSLNEAKALVRYLVRSVWLIL